MNKPKGKPQGESGAIKFGPVGVEWQVIPFPGSKPERELLIARLFVKSFDGYVAMESDPSLGPFTGLQQNAENDLDFTVQTAQGPKLMELAEFAPLHVHGPTFAHAPKALNPAEKAARALELIQSKSAHQGGADRFLLLYTTEHGFWLDPITIELLRRRLGATPPNFDRVYYLSPHDLDSGSTSELFPGTSHHFFGNLSDEQITNSRPCLPHPSDLIEERVVEWHGQVRYGGRPIPARMRVIFHVVGAITRSSAPLKNVGQEK